MKRSEKILNSRHFYNWSDVLIYFQPKNNREIINIQGYPYGYVVYYYDCVSRKKK